MVLSCMRCSVVLGAQLYHADVYKPYMCVQWWNQEFFMAGEVLAKKGIIYGRYYSYIISVIYNTLISVKTKLGQITIWLF